MGVDTMSNWTRKDNTWVNFTRKNINIRLSKGFDNGLWIEGFGPIINSASWRYFANKKHHIFFETHREPEGWILYPPGGNTQGFPHAHYPEHKQFFVELFGQYNIYLPLRRDLEPLMKLYVEEWVKVHGE